MRRQLGCVCLSLFFGFLSPVEATAPFVGETLPAHRSDTASFSRPPNQVHEGLQSEATLPRSQIQWETPSHSAQTGTVAGHVSRSSGPRPVTSAPEQLLSTQQTHARNDGPLPAPADQDEGLAGRGSPFLQGDESQQVEEDKDGPTPEEKARDSHQGLFFASDYETISIAPFADYLSGWRWPHGRVGSVPGSFGLTSPGDTSSRAGAPSRTLRGAEIGNQDRLRQQAADGLAKLLEQRFADDPEIRAVADSITVERASEATAACPSFSSTWSRCSSGCGRGTRYRILQEARGSSCAVKLSSQGCIGISKCTSSQAKWEALGVSKPPDMPEVIFFDLADKLPPEEEWDSVVEAGKVYQVFRSGLSPRYFKGQILSDDACGLAVRSFFSVEEASSPDGRKFLNKFPMIGAYVPCPGDEEALRQKTQPLPHLSHWRALPPLPRPSQGPYKVQDRRGSSEPLTLSAEDRAQFEKFRDMILDKLPEFRMYAGQLKPTKFQQSFLAKCPFIESTSTACTSTCGLGRILSFRVLPDSGNVCQIAPALAECEAVSGCPDADSRWRVLRISRPSYIPVAAFNQLAMLIPSETSWERVEMPGGNFCDIFVAAGYTDRFKRGGGHEVLTDDAGGSAVRAYFLREVREANPGVWRCVSFLGVVDADVVQPIPEASVDTVLLQEHNKLRRRYGVPELRFNASLKRFAEYWAWRLEQDHNCGLHHSDQETRVAYIGAEFESTGENLSVACTAGDSTWEGVPAGWFEEVHCYKYGKVGNPCTAQLLKQCDPKSHAEGIMVGHFTQVMSELSDKVGCAVRYCAQPCKLGKLLGQRVLTVCNYANSGNVVDKFPFSRRVARWLQSIHPEILEAADDPVSRQVCQQNLKDWEQRHPSRDI